MDALLEAAKIVKAAFGVPLVAPGQTYTTKVSWRNTGTQSHAFDLFTCYGTYNPSTGKFTPYRYVFLKQNVSSSAGQSLSTDIACKVESDTPAGKYDCMVILCDLHTEDGTVYIDKQYDVLVKENLLEVGAAPPPGVAAEISNFTIIT